MRRMLAILVSAGAVAAAVSFPVSADTLTQIVADGSGAAFTIRPGYDAGGANMLNLYVGYSGANVATPEPQADGQASWYNLAIFETGIFRPAEDCTPEKNAQATVDGVGDVQNHLDAYLNTALGEAQAGRQPPAPTLPGPRHACTDRFPGFAQSRYPSTATMPMSSSDNYFDKPMAAQACREDPASSQCGMYKQYWPSFRSATGAIARDGSFLAESKADPDPSQRSEALLLGVGDGAVVSVGVGRTSSNARIEGDAIIVDATSTLDNVCVLVSGDGCTLQIDHLLFSSRVEKHAGGQPVKTTRTTVLGVHGSGQAQDVTAEQLQADKGTIDLGGYFKIQPVGATHTCDPGEADPEMVLADAGGLFLTGKSGENGTGGGLMIGGACARARIQQTTFEVTAYVPQADIPPIPPREIVIPGDNGPVVPVGPAPVRYGPARVVTRTVTRYTFERPIAWRTLPYWGPLLGILAVFGAGCVLFPRYRATAPAVHAASRFARQFLRG